MAALAAAACTNPWVNVVEFGIFAVMVVAFLAFLAFVVWFCR